MVMKNIEREWTLPLVIISTLSFTTEAALYMLIQLYLKDLQIQPLIIGFSTTLIWLGMLIGSPLWGMLCDHWPRKPILFVILITNALVIGVFALLLPLFGLLPIVLLRALIVAGLTPVTMAIVSGAISSDRRGRNLSYISSSRALGGAFGNAMVGFLLVALGFRWVFLVLAALPLFALPLLFHLSEERKARSRAKVTSFKSLMKRDLRGLYLGTILRWMGTVGSFSLIYVYMVSLGISPESMGMVSALSPTMSVLGILLFGRLADRVGRRRVFLFGFGLSALVPLIFASAQDVWGMAVGFLTLGISSGSVYIGSAAYISDIIPVERHGVMLGLFEASRGLGGVLGPLVAGAITPIFGFRGMFLTMVGIVAFGFLLVLFSPREPSPSVRNGR